MEMWRRSCIHLGLQILAQAERLKKAHDLREKRHQERQKRTRFKIDVLKKRAARLIGINTQQPDSLFDRG